MHVVATAGHVDHGKSTLVRALTGMEPDRWAEERRRGMTLDLGFAWTGLPSGATVAFVDVPGHERFVPTMLAGVGPVPAVLVVVAADGGWMPQSAEHLDALDALGVRHGLLAVTRADLADPGPARDRALAEIAATSLGDVEAVAVSGTTGAGLDALRAALDRLVATLPAPDPAAPVRLWVDRVFTVRGSGTVVTGTLGAGTLRTGDELELVPDGGRRVGVRGLQSLGRPVEAAYGTARVAANLRGVAVDEIARGTALVTPGSWTVTSTVDVRLSRTAGGRAAGRARAARRLRRRPGPDPSTRDGHRPGRRAPPAAAARRRSGVAARPRPAGGAGRAHRARRRPAGPAPARRGSGTGRGAVHSGGHPDEAGELRRRGAVRAATAARDGGAGSAGAAAPATGWSTPGRPTGGGRRWPGRWPRTPRLTRWSTACRWRRPGSGSACRTSGWSRPCSAVPAATPTAPARIARRRRAGPAGRGRGRRR